MIKLLKEIFIKRGDTRFLNPTSDNIKYLKRNWIKVGLPCAFNIMIGVFLLLENIDIHLTYAPNYTGANHGYTNLILAIFFISMSILGSIKLTLFYISLNKSSQDNE